MQHSIRVRIDQNDLPRRIQLSPNPTSDAVVVFGLKAGDAIQIYNLLGAVVYRAKASTESHVVAHETLPSGIYIVAAAGKSVRLIKR